MILLVHFHCDVGHRTWQTDDDYDWPLTCQQYNALEIELQNENKYSACFTITGITPLKTSDEH